MSYSHLIGRSKFSIFTMNNKILFRRYYATSSKLHKLVNCIDKHLPNGRHHPLMYSTIKLILQRNALVGCLEGDDFKE